MWAQDYLAKHPAKKHIINDSSTPSGPYHIGSLRSPIIHDVLTRVLTEEKREVVVQYGFDDFDPFDGLPVGLSKDFAPELGKPLFKVPSPSGKFANFGEEYSKAFEELLKTLGVKATHYRTSELYQSGKFDLAIRKVLDQADKIRTIFAEVSGSKRDPRWFPFQVICPNCGKLGTTIVLGWDGKEVNFECRKDLVAWAQGCGFKGQISPFGGTGKMNWKVEWAAKWDLFGVTIEAAGKDHASAGGSFDVAEKIYEEVFGKTPFPRFPHEFFLLKGKKMAASKGLVITGPQALEVMPPEVFRFLLVRSRPMQAIEIDFSQVVPKAYDEYDRCQTAYLEKTDQDLADYFYYGQVNPKKIDGEQKLRFSDVTNMVQLPSMKEELDKPEVRPRLQFAKAWLEKYAPEEIKFLVQEKLPSEVKSLTAEQKEFLKEAVANLGPDSDVVQASLYELSKKLGLTPAAAFQAVYLSLIGKPSGPRAGMLLASLPKTFVKERFLEAAA